MECKGGAIAAYWPRVNRKALALKLISDGYGSWKDRREGFWSALKSETTCSDLKHLLHNWTFLIIEKNDDTERRIL